jgi:uncharacterized membrane protein
MEKILNQDKLKKRFWEIDFLRGIVIIGVVVFHFLYNLNYFYDTNIPLFRGFGNLCQKTGVFVLLFLVGISLSISKVQKKAPFTEYLLRGSKTLGCAMLITIVTMFIYPKNYVIFGILHLIGTATILAYFFRDFKYVNLILGVVIIILGIQLKKYTATNNWFLAFGITSSTFSTLDYFPLLPWFGVVLIGLFIGGSIYDLDKRKFKFIDEPKNSLINSFCFIGRHSLLIYLFHPPLFYGLLITLKFLFP